MDCVPCSRSQQPFWQDQDHENEKGNATEHDEKEVQSTCTRCEAILPFQCLPRFHLLCVLDCNAPADVTPPFRGAKRTHWTRMSSSTTDASCSSCDWPASKVNQSQDSSGWQLPVESMLENEHIMSCAFEALEIPQGEPVSQKCPGTSAT